MRPDRSIIVRGVCAAAREIVCFIIFQGSFPRRNDADTETTRHRRIFALLRLMQVASRVTNLDQVGRAWRNEKVGKFVIPFIDFLRYFFFVISL